MCHDVMRRHVSSEEDLCGLMRCFRDSKWYRRVAGSHSSHGKEGCGAELCAVTAILGMSRSICAVRLTRVMYWEFLIWRF